MNESQSKVVGLIQLLPIREQLRRQGKTLVFTNGCFDLLHVGHIHYLQEARQLGDALVVGLNADATVEQLKGPGRPLVPQAERAEMLAALECVDWVTVFVERTAEHLVACLRPEVYCKGGDCAFGRPMPEAAVVAEYGGAVRILSYEPGHSSTELVAEILERYGREPYFEVLPLARGAHDDRLVELHQKAGRT